MNPSPQRAAAVIPKREMAASVVFAAFLFLLLGGVWVGFTRFLPSGIWRQVATCALGVAFVVAFIGMLIKRVKRILASQFRIAIELPMALFNLSALLLAFAAIYARYGIIDTTQGGEVTHNFGHALYYSVVTFTTLGYGDFQPQGVGRAMAAMQAFTGYLILGILASTGATILQKQSQQLEESLEKRNADRNEG